MANQSEHILPAAHASARHYPMGDNALVLEFGDSIKLETHHKIQAIAALLAKHSLPGLLEWVPAYTSLTLFYDPWTMSDKGKYDPYARLLRHVQQLSTDPQPEAPTTGRLVEIPVCYGGAYGPDLAFVAAHNGMSAEAFIALHSAPEYVVYMIGFTPGFPYLGGMDESISAPRKMEPRGLVPAGSVGIAGKQTGIYPLESPGGWQLIGRTPLLLFSPARKQPSLLKAGDRVRFVPVSSETFERRHHEP